MNANIVNITAKNCQTPEGKKNIDTMLIIIEILTIRYDKYAIHIIIGDFLSGYDRYLK